MPPWWDYLGRPRYWRPRNLNWVVLASPLQIFIFFPEYSSSSSSSLCSAVYPEQFWIWLNWSTCWSGTTPNTLTQIRQWTLLPVLNLQLVFECSAMCLTYSWLSMPRWVFLFTAWSVLSLKTSLNWFSERFTGSLFRNWLMKIKFNFADKGCIEGIGF